jgi:murein DD-endopeptidase MepM/ murein hydrolase activator NlpD
MAHIRRWDDLRLLFRNLIQVLYFFHPIVWLCARRMGEERERICDEMVLVRGALSPRDYSRSLLQAIRLGWESPHSAATVGNHKRRISMRIQRILNGSTVKERGRAVPFVTLVILGAFLLPMARFSQSAVVRFEAQPAPAMEMANPLPEGRVTSGFGERKNPFSGKVEHHAGIDIAAPQGTKVLAPTGGVVEIAETDYPGRADFGTVVVIDHGKGVKTFYAHLESLAVEAGRRVAGGDTIGTVGSTGLSRGPHLHFEIWKDEQPVDPVVFVPEFSSR